MKELKIWYVGDDQEYWKSLQEALSEFDQFELLFNDVSVKKSFRPHRTFVELYNADADIIYIDLTQSPEKTLSLCKLLCRNNVTRPKSTVGLHSNEGPYEEMMRSVLAGVRLNYKKGVDFEDVAFHPISLLDSSVRPHYEYALGSKMRPFAYHQVLRVGYIADDHYRVETNAPLGPDSIIELEGHPLEAIMSGKRFYVQDYSDTDLYYNQRFSYNLKYTYVDSKFFRASEDSWLTFKEERRASNRGASAEGLEYVKEDVERRIKELSPVKSEVRKWVDENQSEHAPKRLKVLVVDETLEIFNTSGGNIDEFNYSINFQTRLTKNFYQIRRYRPHLIIFHFEEEGENGKEELRRVVAETRKLSNYEPYILVFNCQRDSESLQEENGYEHLLCYKGEVDLEIIRKLSGLLDERFHITEPEGKTFLKTLDSRSVAFMKRTGALLKFNESELYFESDHDVPMWTCFVLKEPFEAIITVLPFGDHSPNSSSSKRVYRALINGVGDVEKRTIRKLVNTSLGDSRAKK